MEIEVEYTRQFLSLIKSDIIWGLWLLLIELIMNKINFKLANFFIFLNIS